ncbi:hypothetical protein BV898_13279 [Hypsibius exemplaris]|uniref:Uncharacterized protein n=1 Tax=Hypsibius exemplaris TaxID=2072580 RepID=A0A1W0WB90_HYPEX|nr:hypothetical protein BV898_13279 [Hypsibius exemplaris]
MPPLLRYIAVQVVILTLAACQPLMITATVTSPQTDNGSPGSQFLVLHNPGLARYLVETRKRFTAGSPSLMGSSGSPRSLGLMGSPGSPWLMRSLGLMGSPGSLTGSPWLMGSPRSPWLMGSPRSPWLTDFQRLLLDYPVLSMDGPTRTEDGSMRIRMLDTRSRGSDAGQAWDLKRPAGFAGSAGDYNEPDSFVHLRFG